MNKKTAIVIFANSAKKEGISKPFYKSVELFDALNTQTVEIVQKTKLPFFIIDENKQKGSTFAERLKNAIQSTFDKGYKNVIAIGNDTPELTSSHLLKAAQNLEKNKTVIGPSLDGGFYLLGIQKSAFEKIPFLKLPWRTSKLYTAITKVLSNLGIETSTLDTLQDIDAISDAKNILNQVKQITKSIRAILISLFQIKSDIFKVVLLFFKKTSLQNYFNKGSPLTSF